MAVLKGNAHGLGAVPVARHCKTLGVEAIAMGKISEGIQLRKAGIEGTNLILGEYSISDILVPIRSLFTGVITHSTRYIYSQP